MANTVRRQSFPACFVELPPRIDGRRAAFYLAAEEYMATHYPEDNYLFTWRLSPTVVMGRNQVAHREIDLDFCRREGIDVIRRKSGGGCIFADRNNIMISLVTGEGAVEPLFAEYAETVARGLCRLGAEVTVSGRNDILLKDGRKVCGNAFYHMPRRNIVHGTMLYDTDARLMGGALRPEQAKLKAAGVASVRSRIGLLKEQLPFGTEQLEKELRSMLCNRTLRLTDDDVAHIETIEAGYYAPAYLYGQTAHADVTCSGRIEGCGSISVSFSLKGTLVERVSLTGDFFCHGDAEATFNRAFRGTVFTPTCMTEAVREHHPELTVRHLTAEALTQLIVQQMTEDNPSAET